MSSSDIAISVRGLSKSYTITHEQEKHSTLAETLLARMRDPFRRAEKDTFWALKDVSFDVQKGEVVGIIGRNGAGKSTLLKILSRITEPTQGEINLYGRIASLLEVGTGFHPELTGRENIFLNGAILGMNRMEIRHSFDAIIAFAEIEKFLDTPVKRYSSGMYVRLAFAVAAHLSPEILIVDEVLAVGDAEFQKKCLGKMKDVAVGGRTVLFVSHNMQAVGALCDKAIWLKQGQICEQGNADAILNSFLRENESRRRNISPLSEKPRAGSGSARFTSMRIKQETSDAEKTGAFFPGANINIILEITASKTLEESNVAITIYDFSGYRLVDVNTAIQGVFLSLPAGKSATVSFTLQTLLLKPGTYTIELWLGRGGIEDIDFVREAGVLEISENAAAAHHSESFPAPYQCHFTHYIQKHDP